MDNSESFSSFSQFGEDMRVWKYFAQKNEGFFIEAGANDPENLSQTLFLEKNGWQGVLVEPQSACCNRLRQFRKARVFQVACGAPEQRGKALLQFNDTGSKLSSGDVTVVGPVEEVQVMTLDEIVGQVNNPSIDFLSIDVEGFELQVLRGFNIQKHRPRLVLMEDNLPSRLPVHRHMRQSGYRLVKRTGCNNWYIPQEQPFALSTPWERVKLFRKMFIGTAFRQMKETLFRKRRD